MNTKKIFSPEAYNAARAYYQDNNIPHVESEEIKERVILDVIDLQDLVSFAINPLKFHLKSAYGIYFDREEEKNPLTSPKRSKLLLIVSD